MKNYSQPSGVLENQIIQFLNRLQISLETEISSEVNSLSKSDNEVTKKIEGLRVKSGKYHDFIRLLLLYHFGDYSKGLKTYLALDVSAKLEKNFEFHWINILYENKFYFLKWLITTQTITSQQFFGSILNIERFAELLKKIKIVFRSTLDRPVKKDQFIRGYRDKGSLRDSTSTGRIEADSFPDYDQILRFHIRQEQIQLEKDSFREFLVLGDRVLSKELLVKFRLIKGEKLCPSKQSPEQKNPSEIEQSNSRKKLEIST